MNLLKSILVILIFYSVTVPGQHDRKVLVEVFTNSHCPHCPAAHDVIDDYLGSPNGEKISYIFYHMVYPYPSDQLYQESMEDSDARDNYYNPISATPQGWFDGTHQGPTSGWIASLDNLVLMESPLNIILSGTRNNSQFSINAEITRSGNVPANDLVIHFVVVEDLYYAGLNGITNHKHVMRKMLPTPDGQSFSIDLFETINIQQAIELNSIWDADSLSVVVFVQSTGSITIYQSETISYNELNVTGLNDSKTSPEEFILEQNYPNPFNPTTVISYQLLVSGDVSLKVFDLLGREVAILVDEFKPAGKYEIEFSAKGGSTFGGNAYDLPSGIYFYRLTAGNNTSVKKLMLLK